MRRKIVQAVEAFGLELTGRSVLTEAATGNFVVTAVIAALAGAEVTAFARSTRYGGVDEIRRQTETLAQSLQVAHRIQVIESLEEVPWEKVEVVTNTGHLRPIDSAFVARLPAGCVLPLMWEPWEYRPADLDLGACLARGIQVYGTNEQDPRLRTMDYLGYLVLSVLLQHKLTPFSAEILLVGGEKFLMPVRGVLERNGYPLLALTDLENLPAGWRSCNVVVLLEHERDRLLVDAEGRLLGLEALPPETLAIHICGRVAATAKLRFFPESPRPFGYMSMTPDQVDPKAVVDLHTAGLKVAEGMLAAGELGLEGGARKSFLESNYPALSFDDPRYW